MTWTKKIYYGQYDDPLLLRLLSLALIPHYERLQDTEALLFLYTCAGFVHIEISRTANPEAGKEAVFYYKKVLEYKDAIDTFSNPLSRDYIFIAYSNLIRIGPLINGLSLSEAYELLEELLSLRKQKKFCQYDAVNPRIPFIVNDTKRVFYNCPILLDIINLHPDSPIRSILAERVKNYYPKHLAQAGSLYSCEIDVVFHYHLVMAQEGLMSWDEVWKILSDFYLFQLKHIHQKYNVDKNAMYFNYPLNLMQVLEHTSLPRNAKQVYYKFYRTTAADYVKSCTSGFQSYDMNYAIQRFVFHPLLLQSFESQKARENYIYNMVVFRHLNTHTHSVMVARITDLLITYTLANKPELLVGYTDELKTKEDVLFYKNEICDYMHRAALLHDIGKNALTDIINTQYCKITDYAFSIVKKHSEKGAEFLSRHEDFHIYQDIALGHHISYDGKTGYPSDFDKNASPFRCAIDFIRISDCLDAATDNLGRFYHRAKSFDEIMNEFKEGSGTLYHPDIVELIFENPELYKALENMTGPNRKNIYYEIYQTFVLKF